MSEYFLTWLATLGITAACAVPLVLVERRARRRWREQHPPAERKEPTK